MRPNNRPVGNTDLRPKPVHNVLGETEGDRLWGGEDLALVEGHAEVDVDEVAGLHVDEDVVDVSVAEAWDCRWSRKNFQQQKSCFAKFLSMFANL